MEEERVPNTLYKYERNKILEYLGEETYEYLKKKKAFLAGGAILSIFSGTKVNDFDLYFRDNTSAVDVLLSFDRWSVLSYTTKSVLITECTDNPMVNIITFKYFNTLQEVFNSFDFTVSMGGFDFETEEFIFDERFHRDIIGRKLHYSTTNYYPIGSLLRIHKYEEKGFTISKRELVKIAIKVADLKIRSVKELENHINGMYGEDLELMWKEQGLGDVNTDSMLTFISNFDSSLSFMDKGEWLCVVDAENVDSSEYDKALGMSLKAASKMNRLMTKIVAELLGTEEAFLKYLEIEGE